MEKMTKKDRFKKFIYDHREDLAAVTTAVVAYGVILKVVTDHGKKHGASAGAANTEKYNSWADTQNEWLDKQYSEGKKVYLLHDYSYLTMPEDTEVEWIQSI